MLGPNNNFEHTKQTPKTNSLGVRLPPDWLAAHEDATWAALGAAGDAGAADAAAAAAVAEAMAALHERFGYGGGGGGGGGGGTAAGEAVVAAPRWPWRDLAEGLNAKLRRGGRGGG